jgi:sugar phosphate permease
MKARIFSGTPGRVFMLLCAMYFIEYVDRVNLSVAAPLIKEHLHLSNSQLGLALSAFGFCYASFQIICGYLGDRLGARRMLTFSGILWALGTLSTGFVGGFAGLLVSRTIVGLGEAGTIPTATRAITRWVPKVSRGFAQGFTHSSARAAAAITPPVVVLMIPLIGWRGAFVVLGCVSAVWVSLWYWYSRDDPRDHPSITADELAALPEPIEAATVRVKDVPWLPLLKRILPVTGVFFCHAWTLWLYLSWLPSFFVGNYGINLKSSALFTSGVFIAGVVGDTAGGLLTDAIFRRTGSVKRARRDAVIIGMTGSLIFLLPVFFLRTPALIAVSLAASLFFLEMTEGPIWAVPIDVAPAYVGSASGFISTAAGLAAIVSPAAFGFIVDVTGSYRLPFVCSIVLLLAGIVLSFWIRADIALVPPDPGGDSSSKKGKLKLSETH